MPFASVPQQFFPLDREINYTFEQDRAKSIDFRIINNTYNQLIGVKRPLPATSVTINIAAILRSQIAFTPRFGASGFRDLTDRGITIRVEAVETDSGLLVDTSPVRTFLIGDQQVITPGIRTTMPLERIIPADASDEISLLTEEDCTLYITAEGPDSTQIQSYSASGAGLHIFYLSPADFPGCETLTLDAGRYGEIRYTVVPASEEFTRIAWQSHAGSVEQYSFPVTQSTTLRTSKQRAEGYDGHLVTQIESSREMTFVSALEREEVLEPLCEILSSPNVWINRHGGFIPLDILSEEAVIRQYGVLRTLEIVSRPKNDQQWI